MTAPRFDVTITDGRVAEIRRAVTYVERNRLVDFAWRHELRAVVRAGSRTRAGTGDVPVRAPGEGGTMDTRTRDAEVVLAVEVRRGEPQHVADDFDELLERVGELFALEQCDGCGNTAYRLEVRGSARPPVGFDMVCTFVHACGSRYPVRFYREDEVIF